MIGKKTAARPAVRWLATAAALAFLGCREANPVQPHEPVAAISASLFDPLASVLRTVTGLVSCAPMPAASASAVIGRRGGTIIVGAHTLTIPPNALRWPVRITAVAPTDRVNRMHFEPHGLRFREPATVTMSYANCSVLRHLLPGHIAYVDEHLTILEVLDAIAAPARQTVSSDIEHFSDYALSW